MTPENLLEALTDIDGRAIRNARREESRPVRRRGRKFVFLLAAVVALMTVTTTAFAAEEIRGWFLGFFADNSSEELSQAQIEYIEENEQTIELPIEQEGSTVELKAGITDGEVAYFIFRVTAPEGVNVNDMCIGNWGYDVLLPKEGTLINRGLSMWERDDGDGLDNTAEYVLLADAAPEDGGKPFTPGRGWKLHIENLTVSCTNEAYLEALKAENESFTLNDEESRKAYPELTLAEGVWDYELTFEDSDLREIELLKEPVTAKTWIGWTKNEEGESVGDYRETTITSIRLRALSVTFIQEPEWGNLGGSGELDNCYVVMKDGSRVALGATDSTLRGKISITETPIVLEEADYLLLGDGTRIDVP